jgi:AraC-like DNA-binding protein/mannose-6-phosphate isomerase-like protein (cupin superfamily)
MDKNRKVDDRITHTGKYEVHRLPQGSAPVHREYGLWIVHTGSNQAPVNGFDLTPQRYFEYYAISHLHAGKGRLWLAPDREELILPGQCVVVPPRVVHRYGGTDNQWYEEDTICFSGPVADMLLKAGVIKPGVYELGHWRVLLPLIQLARDPSRDSQIGANIALQKLLTDMYLANRTRTAAPGTPAAFIEKLIVEIRRQIQRWWTVEEMAQFCGLSSDQFRRVFKKQTGMLPKLYVDKLKLQQGAEMLASSKSSVADIAEQLAYQDCYHFSRRFKAVMGLSPRQYRQAFGNR